MIMGANSISCPENKCEKTVDEAVLLTFINVFEVLNLKRRAMDITLPDCTCTLEYDSETTLSIPNRIVRRMRNSYRSSLQVFQ
jgi:hypothetical protein